MNKMEAIKWFQNINSGDGVDRYKRLDIIPRGKIAVAEWDNGLFTLGIEYGVMIAIAEIFDLKKEELLICAE